MKSTFWSFWGPTGITLLATGFAIPGLSFHFTVQDDPATHRVSGRVSTADGLPHGGCRVVVLNPGFEPAAETACDEEGRYLLELPDGTYNGIAILDDGYGKETLEFWAWNVPVTGDLRLDAVIDRLEVYNLAVWNSKGGPPSIYVSFRPMSLERVLAGGVREGEVMGAPARILDSAPALDSSSLHVRVDGEVAAVESLQWVYERITVQGGGSQYLPVVVAQVARPPLTAGTHEVRVRITDRETGEIGEAVSWFTSNAAGLGW